MQIEIDKRREWRCKKCDESLIEGNLLIPAGHRSFSDMQCLKNPTPRLRDLPERQTKVESLGLRCPHCRSTEIVRID